MKYEDFLNNLKQEEIQYYDKLVKAYYDVYSKRSDFQLDDPEHSRWSDYNAQLDSISTDYDVYDYAEMLSKYGEDKYKSRLDNRISEHITKLDKQTKKEIGAGVSVENKGNNVYHIEGNNGSCDILVSPIKTSSSNAVVKTRIKISNVIKRDKPLDYVPEKEDNEYIKRWKENELKASLDGFNKFVSAYSQLRDEYSSIQRDFNASRGTENQENLKKKKEESYNKLHNFLKSHSYYAGVCRKIGFRFNDPDASKTKLIETLKKDINEHFKVLQAKVENKIGEIVEIDPFDASGTNYHFEGAKGSCNVEVILAGGYNIQRLHTRWIVTRVKPKNEAK